MKHLVGMVLTAALLFACAQAEEPTTETRVQEPTVETVEVVPTAEPTPDPEQANPTDVPENTVIFDEQAAEQEGLEYNLYDVEIGGYWSPSAKDIELLEAGLVEYLQNNGLPEVGFSDPVPVEDALPDYYRQYFGYIAPDGSRVIFGNYFCDAVENWQKQWVLVLDGGTCFFELEYNLDTGTHFNLSVHGEA